MDLLEQTTSLLGELIAFATVSSDSNLKMITRLEQLLVDAGATCEIWHDASGKKANLFATIGPEIDGGIVLSGHTDVVPVTDQSWASDPFKMVARDERLFGRGACDMKGFIAAAVSMAPRYAALKLTRPIHYAFTYDEETGCLGARALALSLGEMRIKPAIVIIGEPTLMRIIEGHKGCYEYTTCFTGHDGHGSDPDRGVNAVEYAVRYVGELLDIKADLRGRVKTDSNFDPPFTTINTGAFVGGIAHNVIPGKARVDWEMRPVQTSDATYVKDRLDRFCTEDLIPKMRAVDPDAGIVTHVIGEVEGLEPMAQNAARDLVIELTGANQVDLVSFGTEAGIFQNLGMDVVVCGPGSIEQAHTPDEFVTLDQLSQCLNMLTRLEQKIC